MAVILPHSVFLRIPRTGSAWARDAIAAAGIPCTQEGYDHSVNVPRAHRSKLIFTFVRHPQRWIISRWAMGRFTDSLSSRWDADPVVFYGRVSIGDVWSYFAPYTWRSRYVGHTERLADDLVEVLNLAGEKFDEAVLRACPRPANDTRSLRNVDPEALMRKMYRA